MVVKVASVSFSKDPILRVELAARFPAAVFNDAGVRFKTPDLKTYLADADAAVIGLEKIDDEVLTACPRLRMIAKYGVGLDGIDLDACRTRGVAVGWTPGVNRRSVAELAVCFLIGLFRNVFQTSSWLRGGTWNKDGGRQLTGATIGIIGLGHVGRDIVGLLKPFGCRILANDVVDVSAFAREHGIEVVEKDVLFRDADAVSLHVPLTPLTRALINADVLSRFKPGAFLLNTSRGEVVDQESVKQALLSGRLGGAALDVFEVEPPTDVELLGLPEFVGTPHIGGNAREAILAMGRSAIAHLDRFFPAALPRPASTTERLD